MVAVMAGTVEHKVTHPTVRVPTQSVDIWSCIKGQGEIMQ